MLQEFLGTANYAKPHAGPFYAKVAAPLAPLLGKNPMFPMTAEQEAAVQGLKDLMCEQHRLAVPDEAAAIEAANAWLAGLPPAGRPYEGGVRQLRVRAGRNFRTGRSGQHDLAAAVVPQRAFESAAAEVASV